MSEALKHCYYQYICIKSVERVIGKQKDRNGCQKKKKTQKSRINVARSKSNLFIYHSHHHHHFHHRHLCIFIFRLLMSMFYWYWYSLVSMIIYIYIINKCSCIQNLSLCIHWPDFTSNYGYIWGKNWVNHFVFDVLPIELDNFPFSNSFILNIDHDPSAKICRYQH